MFANLKNKLIEEVKSSPKLQQFANAAQAAVSSSSTPPSQGSDSTTSSSNTTTNENFFSITEEDTPQNSPYKPLKLPAGAGRGQLNNGSGTGAIPRTRKLSNSSMASDVSFRLPSYDSPAVYHLQSDLESEVGSEMEDSASTAKLDVVTKEQLYDAYKKSLDRYHKYRSRYTDLARKYRDLERDSTKARSVLVETQEKAIRRISELREQCTLEQQAKAHLEESLRVEMDDMQCKMQAYQTKLTLLGENPENVSNLGQINEPLIDLASNTATDENANKIASLEKELKDREAQFAAITEKMAKSTATIEILRKQEEENALLLAQTKQAIHSELENKESEVKVLTDSVKQLQGELQVATQQEKKSGEQSGELRELKEKLKQTQTAKQEVDARIIAAEHMLAQLKEQYVAKEKVLSTAEERIAALTKESDLKLQDLRQQNAQLSEMVQRYQQNEVSLAEIDNELNRTKNENDNLRATITENERQLQSLERDLSENTERAESSKQERLVEGETLNAEKTKVKDLSKQLEAERVEHENDIRKVQQLESELRILNEQNANTESETIAALKAELHKTNTDLGTLLSSLREQHVDKENELKAVSNKLAKQKKHHETQQSKFKEQTTEVERLKNELRTREQYELTIRDESRLREEQTEQEKNELREQVANILHEISEMEEQMGVVQHSHASLESEKLKLETSIEQMQRQTENAEQGTQHWRDQLVEAEERLKLLTERLQNVESENSQLAERNCLLTESSNRLEKLIAERERQQVDELSASEMRVKLETAEDTIEKLNEKMTQVLDENSRMHNAQELMDHDCRTLQDKCDALEKEKLATQDSHKCLVAEMVQFKERKIAEESEMREQSEKSKHELQERIVELQREVEVKKVEIKNTQQKGKEKAEEFERTSEQLEKAREELVLLREQQESLNKELNAAREELSEKTEAVTKYEYSLNELQGLKNELLGTKNQLENIKENTNEFKIKLLEDAQVHQLEVEKERDAIKERIENLEHEMEVKQQESEQQIVQLKEQLESFDRVNQELESAREELTLLKEQKESLNQELSGANEELIEKNQSLKELQLNLCELQELTEAFKITKSELESVRKNETKLNAEIENNKVLLNAKVEEEEKIKSQLENSDEWKEQLDRAREELQKLGANEESMRAEFTESKEKYVQQIENLEEKLNAANTDVEMLHESNDALQVSFDKLKSKHQLQVDDMESALKQLQTENGSMKAQVKATTDNAEKLINYEQIAIENEFLNTNAKHLESELERQKQATDTRQQDTEVLKEKLKSLQCEMYVLKESAEKYNVQLEAKEKELNDAKSTKTKLSEELAVQRLEYERQTEHTKFVTIQNDAIQTELTELEQKLQQSGGELEELRKMDADKEQQLQRNLATVETLTQKITEITADLECKDSLEQELEALKIELAEQQNREKNMPIAQGVPSEASKSSTTTSNDAEHLRRINETLQHELEDLKYKSSAEISSLQQEIEDMQSNAKHMTERMTELECLRAGMQAQQLLAAESAPSSAVNVDEDKAELESKLKGIMSEVQDVSNRNLFLEQKCENFLILEQSNERLKLQNAKLSRQLDETLVSMQHNEGITANTEFEYLKNIMFQYLTGSANGNNETLVKVISAVLKFSPQQTQVALEKEHQRRSLINKIL